MNAARLLLLVGGELQYLAVSCIRWGGNNKQNNTPQMRHITNITIIKSVRENTFKFSAKFHMYFNKLKIFNSGWLVITRTSDLNSRRFLAFSF